MHTQAHTHTQSDLQAAGYFTHLYSTETKPFASSACCFRVLDAWVFQHLTKKKIEVGGGFWEVTASVIGQRLRVAIIC